MEIRKSHDEGQTCYCISEHRPAPFELERHHIWPLGMGGPDVDWNFVFLCPTAHMNVHEFIRFILVGKLRNFRDATDMYDEAVNRYQWDIAVEGVRRATDGTSLRIEPSPEPTIDGPIPESYDL